MSLKSPCWRRFV